MPWERVNNAVNAVNAGLSDEASGVSGDEAKSENERRSERASGRAGERANGDGAARLLNGPQRFAGDLAVPGHIDVCCPSAYRAVSHGV
jgi:hypothetical protein